MKTFLALLAGLLIAAPISAFQVQGNTITLTDEEKQKCIEEGGCLVVTLKQAHEAFAEVAADAAREALIACRNKT